ncbi:MAG: transglutaminase-like domain-containing protein [Candidatus Bathyarchaeota archaeon]|jgi:transglutaminase-like putative cysteine protease
MSTVENTPKKHGFNLYLEPTFVIDSNSEIITEKAASLTGKRNSPKDKAKELFYFVRDKIEYNAYRAFQAFNLSDYCASKTLQRGDGYCIQKAVALTALARAVDIPARLGFADVVNHLAPKKLIEMMGTNVFVYHGYSEFWLNDKWVKATPAFNIEMCQKFGIKPVEFDGVSDSILHKRDEKGELHIEYLRYHGTFPDLPFNEIIQAFMKQYEHTKE